MSKTEANVRVRLDTRGAKAKLEAFTRDAKRASGRVSAGVRASVGRGLGAVGLGGGVGAGVAAAQASTRSGFADVISESLGGVSLQIQEAIFGESVIDARATRSAREESMNAFGMIAGQRGSIPEGARNYFQNIRELRMKEEKGRLMIEKSFRSDKLDFEKVLERLLAEIQKILEGLWEKFLNTLGL